jgi:glycosyltransferase involved in cell wall biosynthesis
MACGTPAICTDVASMPEVVENGVTGFIVPPNDPAALGEKLRWLQAHKDEANRMGENARRRVLELFTWDRVVDRCLAIYNAGPEYASRHVEVSTTPTTVQSTP